MRGTNWAFSMTLFDSLWILDAVVLNGNSKLYKRHFFYMSVVLCTSHLDYLIKSLVHQPNGEFDMAFVLHRLSQAHFYTHLIFSKILEKSSTEKQWGYGTTCFTSLYILFSIIFIIVNYSYYQIYTACSYSVVEGAATQNCSDVKFPKY